MDNLEWLEEMKKQSDSVTGNHWKFRVMKALEIIAEELCKFNAREDNKYDNGYCEQSHDHTG
jgi:hypothetical protein